MYQNNACPKCGHKLAIDLLGRTWCPKCVGKKMAEDAFKKLRLNLKLENHR